MACGRWVLAGMLLAMPALAEDVSFRGHAVQVDASREARPILGVSGVTYSIPGSTAQIVGKAQQCASRPGSGIAVESVDADVGKLVAAGNADYRQKGRRSIRARLTVEARDGYFRVLFNEIATSPADAVGYTPLIQQGGAAWENALVAIIGVEQGLLDCMFR